VKPGWGTYRGLGIKFGIFCNFFRIFWSSNGQITASSTDSPCGPIETRHVTPAPPLSPAHADASVPPRSRRLTPPRARQRGRERDDSARSRPARSIPPSLSHSPASRLRRADRGAVRPPIGTSLSDLAHICKILSGDRKTATTGNRFFVVRARRVRPAGKLVVVREGPPRPPSAVDDVPSPRAVSRAP
jgi:hypothetical protein